MDSRPTDTAAALMAGLNLIQQALSIFDQDLRLVASNRQYHEMFELPPILTRPGASFSDTIRYQVLRGEYGPVEDVDQAVQSRVDQARAFKPHYMERVRANGRSISVEGFPLPQGGWVTVYTDITRTKQQQALLRARSEELSDKVLAYAEELSASNRQLEATISALEETKRQLTETEARTRLTTEMMPAHIAHVDRDRCYSFSNRQLGAVIPGCSSDIVGHPIDTVLGPEAYGAIAAHLDAAFAGKSATFEFSHEPSSRRIRTAMTPDHDADGGIAGVYILSTDVTEETQARTALQQTRRREMAARLTSGMAHDFANLLTIVLGSQSRLKRLALSAEARDLVNATLSAAERGGVLLNRLADITGAREWRPVPADLGAALADLETLAAPALPDCIRLRITNAMSSRALMLDTGMLQDSLLNLILNARDACAGQLGGAGEIWLDVRPVQDTWTEFTVSDNGPGFTDAALDHALEPFFTTKGGEGTGLGLAMVYDMAKLAGGRVRLGNRPEGGAQVVLRLPLRPAPQAATQGATPDLVLLVEDGPELRAAIRAMLTEAGFAVIEAASVNEALSLLGAVPDIALVFSDISLKGDETGLDLIDRLAPEHPPCRLMTSLPPDHALHEAATRRAPVLQKPFTAAGLARFMADIAQDRSRP
jgi:signal transduction histidine kinase